MKRNILLMAGLLSAGLFLFSSCSKIKDAVKINIDLTQGNVNFTIPQITTVGPVTISDQNVYLNVDSIVKAANSKLSVGNITSVKVKSCTVTMLDGDVNNNFSALESFKVQFSSNTNATFYTVAEVTLNPDVESYELTIPVNSSINLKDYFNATNFTYRISGTSRKTTSKDILCKASVKYTLEAGL